jgi:hypothetical protein
LTPFLKLDEHFTGWWFRMCRRGRFCWQATGYRYGEMIKHSHAYGRGQAVVIVLPKHPVLFLPIRRELTICGHLLIHMFWRRWLRLRKSRDLIL